MFKKLLTASMIAGTALSFTAQAEDRALLIGVGEYISPEVTDLPGIELDIDMMKKAAKLMGYDSIKTLLNEQVTLSNVTGTIQDYLINGVSSNDRVLIYFSGHGTNIPDESGDEPDGVDEVLTMHDVKSTTIAGKPSLSGVLIDDTLSALLKKIPSNNTLVLLDACNSGTATKGLKLRGGILGDGIATVAKSFQYRGMPSVSKGNFMVKPSAKGGHFVAISAAGDTESAQATAKGSLFTLGILSAINKAALDKSEITAKSLKKSTTDYINRENKQKPFTPQLSGSEQLANKIIKVRSADNGFGETWTRLTQIVDKAEPLDIRINQTEYFKGDFLKITIKNNRPGYLNVINVGPKDQPTILFPNQFNLEAKVQGAITIPTAQMDFDLTVQKPYGRSLIVAFFTDTPLNLYKSGDGARVEGEKGMVDNLFHSLSALGLQSLTRSFRPEKRASGKVIKAGKVITLVCESKAHCK